MWGEADPKELKFVWADELGRFEGDDIAATLKSMRKVHVDYPPTLFQFSALCLEAKMRRLTTVPRLEGPLVPMPDHIRKQLREFVQSKTVGSKQRDIEGDAERAAISGEPGPQPSCTCMMKGTCDTCRWYAGVQQRAAEMRRPRPRPTPAIQAEGAS